MCFLGPSTRMKTKQICHHPALWHWVQPNTKDKSNFCNYIRNRSSFDPFLIMFVQSTSYNKKYLIHSRLITYKTYVALFWSYDLCYIQKDYQKCIGNFFYKVRTCFYYTDMILTNSIWTSFNSFLDTIFFSQ